MNQREKGDSIDRCFKCGNLQKNKNLRENVPYEKSFEYYAKTNDKEYLLKEFSNKNIKEPCNIYKGNNDKLIWNCLKCNSEFCLSSNDRCGVKQLGCTFCNGHQVNETNCIATTHPEVSDLFKNKSDANRYSYGSTKSSVFKCKECGFESKKKISNVIKQGFNCPRCSDGISYPEKIMINVLNQIGVYYEKEKIFEWSKNVTSNSHKLSGTKRYDFYIPSIDTIIETHGEQHYKNGIGKPVEEEKQNDILKEKIALKNGIKKYIVVDCRESNVGFIKNNIFNSDMSNLFNLENIDWIKCHEFACKSLVKSVCDLWNDIGNTVIVADILNINSHTVVRYLKQGNILKWCNYNPKEELKKNGKNNGRKRNKIVIQLTLNGDFLKEWNSVTEAGDCLGINFKGISNVCRGKSHSSGGFKWIFKSEYKKFITEGGD
jgi:hypothetical protein